GPNRHQWNAAAGKRGYVNGIVSDADACHHLQVRGGRQFILTDARGTDNDAMNLTGRLHGLSQIRTRNHVRKGDRFDGLAYLENVETAHLQKISVEQSLPVRRHTYPLRRAPPLGKTASRSELFQAGRGCTLHRCTADPANVRFAPDNGQIADVRERPIRANWR